MLEGEVNSIEAKQLPGVGCIDFDVRWIKGVREGFKQCQSVSGHLWRVSEGITKFPEHGCGEVGCLATLGAEGVLPRG